MSGLKMVKGKVVKASAKVVVKAKTSLPEVPDQDPVVSVSKSIGSSTSAKAVKVTKSTKEPKENKTVKVEKPEKVHKVTRTGRMGELIASREYTDTEMYDILDKEFGPGKKYLATYRHNMNVRGLEADPKFKPYTRMMRGQDGTIAMFVSGGSSAKKEKKEETKAKITLAVSKLPKK